MRKVFGVFLFFLLMLSNTESMAQRRLPGGFELGLRLGDTYGGSAALDAVLPVYGDRLHGNLSVNHNNLIVAGLYDWLFPVGNGFLFYPGVGGIMSIGDEVSIGVAGEVGFEYRFDIPLSIGLDWRPILGIVNADGFTADGFGLNIRYRF
jgi:hypothetical protein